MNIIFDLFLMGFLNLFTDSEEKKQRRAFKNRKSIAEAQRILDAKVKQRMDADTGLGYIILDELAQRPSRDFQYKEPPTEDLHCYDEDGPEW